MTDGTIRNDVDLDAVKTLVTAIQTDPEKARARFDAEVVWRGGFRSEAHIRAFPPVPSDEPSSLGGTDTAPNPVEQVLAALGNCLAVGYAAGASAAGITLDGLRIELEGDLDLHTFLGLDEGHAGYRGIRVNVRLDTDAPPEEVAALHRRVVATSPVGHTLARPVPVEITLVEGER